jgi:signal peptidase II
MQTASRASLSDDRRRTSRRRLLALLAAVASGVYALDQLSKAVAVDRLVPGRSTELVGEVLRLQLIRNAGAALSLGTGVTWVLTVVALVIVVVVIRTAARIRSVSWAVVLGLLLGGALGNLTDRMLRSPGVGRGQVVDFIAYGDLFIGNVADIAIVAAAGLVLLLTARGTGLDGRRRG